MKKNTAQFFNAAPIGMVTFELEKLTWITVNPKFCQCYATNNQS